MWVAYLDANGHGNSGAEVYAARSTDAGVTVSAGALTETTRYEFDAMGRRVRTVVYRPLRRSSATASWIKSTGLGVSSVILKPFVIDLEQHLNAAVPILYFYTE